MPTVNFVLPHWAYWLVILLFPAIAMVLSRRLGRARIPSLSLAYFIWIVAGYVGLHRLYLKNLWGFVFIALFGVLLFFSGQKDATRDVFSVSKAAVEGAERKIDRATRAIARAERDLARYKVEIPTLEEGSSRLRIAERRLRQQEENLEKNTAALAAAEADLATARPALEDARAQSERVSQWSDYLFYTLIGLILIDGLLLPWLVKKGRERIEASGVGAAQEEAPLSDGRFASQRGFTGWIDRNTLIFGEFVAYWTVLAVFAFLYEVLARKLLNSPTIWVHESVVYLFGMQYLIAGCYAMLTESHVRVDIFYAKFSPRMKAAVDLVTSVFFFLFTLALIVLGMTFALDSIGFGNTPLSAWARGEISVIEFLTQVSPADFVTAGSRNGEENFSTWQMALWPVKLVIVLGAILLLLQGISRVIKDIHILRHGEPLSVAGG